MTGIGYGLPQVATSGADDITGTVGPERPPGFNSLDGGIPVAALLEE